MKKRIKVRCANCKTWYQHVYNTAYVCPNCGSNMVDDWEKSKRLGKFGISK